MKLRRSLALLLTLLLFLLSGCAGEERESEGLLLYYVPVEVTGGSALVGVKSTLTAEDATVEALMEQLLAGPDDPDLRSPIPWGVELQRAWLEDTCLTVDLSERYGGLTDVELTLADYSIVLTLCQLPGVESVRILANGRPLLSRTTQELRPDDLVLSGTPVSED